MSYIGNSPGVASQRVTTTLIATASQTQFTTQSGYVLGYVDVYLNGAKLVNGSDFEAITGTYITLFAGAAVNDVVELISYVPRGLSDGYTKAEADAKFLDVGGDTATGSIFLGAGGLVVGTTQLVTSGTNNVGINTASPKTNGATFGTLTLNGSNGGAIQFTTADVNIAQIYNDGNALFINPSTGKTLSLQVAGSTVASVSSTGIAVTGTLSNTTGVGLATASGNVGIGISSASASGKLHVSQTAGSMYIDTAGGIPRMRLGGGNGWGFNRITASEDIFFGEPGDTGTWRVRGSGTISLGVGSNNTTMTVQGDGGSVGLGTTTPNTYGKLAVRTSTNQTALSVYCNDVGTGLIADFRGYDNSLGELSRLSIQAGGNVFIGTTTNTNSSKLVVAGTISQTVGSTQYLVVDQSDVGTAPNQIPLNQYLGSLAFQDRENINFTGGTGALSSLDLAAISAQLNVSATDVFVYDTSRDSDGGAWRKRTQHTSWYNETLNTQTRGSRREFPAIAVIVATTSSITIYDGDSPDLPMWMVFVGGSQGMAGSSLVQNGNSFTIAAINATLVVGLSSNSDNYGSPIINFISEKVVRMDPQTTEGGTWLGTIADRNSTKGYASYAASGGGYLIANSIINDVTIVVLPNAPIDTTTGLSVPTIAVANQNGVNVIKDNGAVYRLSGSNWGSASYSVAFDKNGLLYFGQMGYYWLSCDVKGLGQNYTNLIDGRNYYQVEVDTYPIKQVSCYDGNGWGASIDPAVSTNNDFHFAHYSNYTAPFDRVVRHHIDKSVSGYQGNSHLMNYTATKYNTGWMIGDTKTACLSDTTQEIIISSELITNGTFDSNVTGWTATGSGASISWNAAGRINVVPGTEAWAGAYTTVQVIAGKTYVITGSIISNGGIWAGISGSYNGGQASQKVFNGAYPGVADYSFTHTATQTGTLYITIDHSNTTSSGTIVADNISCRIADADRSVNNLGLKVLGTLTKTPVAVGADLVAYSGFNGSTNYLQQPYSSALDFGTGDFSFMCWVDLSDISGSQCVFIRSNTSNSNQALGLYLENGTWAIFVGSGSNTSIPIKLGLSFITVKRSGGIVSFYVDGILRTGVFPLAVNTNFTDSAAVLRVGAYFSLGTLSINPSNKVSLLRISATAPSDAQIAKIYNDEKQLFQENAKATVYGTSDPVTALTYDDDTQRLHVGTGSGRSVFQGLRRVDNTTTAVATAISAVDGMVVEN